jgi:hypothetical protein
MGRISWLTANRLASLEGLCSVQLVSKLYIYGSLAIVCWMYTTHEYEGFCLMTPCRLVYGSNVLEELSSFIFMVIRPIRRRRLSPPKTWYLYTNLHGVIFRTARIFISTTASQMSNVKTWCLLIDGTLVADTSINHCRSVRCERVGTPMVLGIRD